MDYKKLWIELFKHMEATNQTNWGKLQVLKLMRNMELEEARKEEQGSNYTFESTIETK